ncbi:DUF4412 domain-containing protein [Allomuricauda sp.]|uniref:DUF4412 domain-containing protein n=1 Tax=Flagellimonas alginolytica TaxID=3177515 RepID=UPI0025F1F6FA|nr:DUF4412 domain-containing protein [Allomuricauda sp.]
MKARTLISTLICFLIMGQSNAQFFKKLKKKAKDAVERTVLERTDKEVSKGTDRAIDSITQGKKGKKTPKSIGETEKNTPTKKQTDAKNKAMEQKMAGLFGGKDLNGVPDIYTFSYKATMKITTRKDETEIQYWMEPDQRYFGNWQEQGTTNSISIMDMENKMVVMFMDDGERKSAMKMPVGKKMMEKMAKKMEQKSNADNVQVTPIGNKTILGYTCQGYQITSKEGISKIWLTNESPVGFLGGMGQAESIPTTGLPIGSNTMFMEMQFESAKKKKDNFSMVCTELVQEDLILVKADYLSSNP